MKSMRHVVVASMVTVVLLILSVGARALAGQESAPKAGEASNSVYAPAGYQPQAATAPDRGLRSIGSADILLIQTSLPWNSAANTIVLDNLGYSYDVVDVGNLESVNLFGYPVILIVNDQVQAFYDAYAAQVATFEAYVNAGGVLLFFAASDGWAEGTLKADLPGGVGVVTPHYEDYNYLETASHPIASGALSDGIPLVNSDLYNTHCSHGYFTDLPAGAVIVFKDQHNHPTLIDYRLGAGRVIASTNTWEHAYKYGGRAFAIKALDDVFLYAFSGGGSVINDLSVELHIEDAPDDIIVRKSRGSYVDVVAEIRGSQAYDPAVTLEVESDQLGAPVKSFTRNLSSDAGYGQENTHENLGSGRYRLQTTLVGLALDNQSVFYKEVVWRFKVPDNAVFGDVALKITATQAGAIITNSTDAGSFKIVDRGNAIVVTNRQRLFDVYGQDAAWSDVRDLLLQTYRAAAQQTGEVFYYERYGLNWAQTTDEIDANAMAGSLDYRLEQWYAGLTSRFIPDLKPDYLLIVGGDEIVPFYRADDDDYFISCLINCEKSGWSEGRANRGPLWDVYADNYFLTDNLYADIGGDKRDWENGDLELSLGRIVGANALDMSNLIRRGMRSPAPFSTAGIASVKIAKLGSTEDAIKERGITLLGIKNPDLTDNDDWTPEEFISEWDKSWQLFIVGLHANPHIIADGRKRPISGLGNENIIENRSLFAALACNLAVPVPDFTTDQGATRVNHSFMLLNEGLSGFVGSTGLARGSNFVNLWNGGDRLVNKFVENLLDGNGTTAHFGDALREAKEDFNPTIGVGRKTVLEFVYYGLPWTNAKVSGGGAKRDGAVPGGVVTTLSTPAAIEAPTYQVALSTSVTDYTLEKIENYDLLVVDGAALVSDSDWPALPFVVETIYLPPGSMVNSLALQSENTVALGTKNLPTLMSVTTYDETSGVEAFTGTGTYPPAARWSYQVVDFPEYTAVEVVIYLASYNGATNALTLFDNTNLLLDYTSETSAVVRSFDVEQPTYAVGQSAAAVADIQNVTPETVDYEAQLSIFDENGQEVTAHNVSLFTIAAGGTYTFTIPIDALMVAGPYDAVLSVLQDGAPIVGADDSYTLIDGEVSAFDVPPLVRQGEYADVSLAFRNLRSEEIAVEAEIRILDGGVEVGKLLSRNFSVTAGNEASTTWAWDPASFPLGSYTLRPVVTVGGVSYPAPDAALRIVGDEPVITSFSPVDGPVGTEVTIAGLNFTGTTAVTFNGVNASFVVDSDEQILATVPDGATTGKIAVTTPAGTMESDEDFTVIGEPQILSFTPQSGLLGTEVTIAGLNFTGTTAVTFNGVNASFIVDSDEQISAAVPLGATTGKIAVTTPAGTTESNEVFAILPDIKLLFLPAILR